MILDLVTLVFLRLREYFQQAVSLIEFECLTLTLSLTQFYFKIFSEVNAN